MSKTAEIRVQGKAIPVSNLEKVLYPAVGFTKADVIQYYIRIAPVLLPHLKNRPLTLKRYPNGVEGEFFYEKECPSHRPKWIEIASVKRRESGHIHFCLTNDVASLVWAANLADLELHTLLSRAPHFDVPTMMVFDLDPGPPADVLLCAKIAMAIRDLLSQMKLESLVKSSGSKGLQLYVPLNTKVDFDATKTFAKKIAEQMEQAMPSEVVSKMSKALRTGKVFVDWSQNDDHKTTICVYSLRAKERPFVSAPLTWEEVEEGLKRKDPSAFFFEPEAVLKRVEKQGDLFLPVLKLKQKLPKPEAIPSISAAPASLKRYQEKRRFDATREPKASPAPSTSAKNPLFVIQKHDASHLHYDFRLEMDGVLKSWAVPKGIPSQLGEKRLAMQVEDHPYDYAKFEGIIPQGQYGGGTVMVWDIGTFSLLGGTSRSVFQEGKIHLQLNGKKLCGEWTLVRLKNSDPNRPQWLLMKTGESHRPISKKQDDQSVLSSRSMKEIAGDRDRTWESHRPSRKTALAEAL